MKPMRGPRLQDRRRGVSILPLRAIRERRLVSDQEGDPFEAPDVRELQNASRQTPEKLSDREIVAVSGHLASRRIELSH
jgi:hypothetical protein